MGMNKGEEIILSSYELCFNSMGHVETENLSHVKYVTCNNKSMSTVHDVSMAGASSATKLANAAASATVLKTPQTLPPKKFELIKECFLFL